MIARGSDKGAFDARAHAPSPAGDAADAFALRVYDVRIAVGPCTLLDGVDFAVESGEIVAIVGANGAGKSTLLRAMSGLEPVAGGRIAVGPRDARAAALRDVATLPPSERARALALVASDAETPHGMSVREVVLVGRYAHHAWWDWTRSDDDATRAETALERVGLERFADRPFDTLSAGERQRAWIALALAQDAPALLLDEPTSHLDVRRSLAILGLLRDLARDDRRAIAIVLHDLGEAAAIADRVVVLGERRMLVCDAPTRAFEEAILEQAFGVRFRRIDLAGRVHVLPILDDR